MARFVVGEGAGKRLRARLPWRFRRRSPGGLPDGFGAAAVPGPGAGPVTCLPDRMAHRPAFPASRYRLACAGHARAEDGRARPGCSRQKGCRHGGTSGSLRRATSPAGAPGAPGRRGRRRSQGLGSWPPPGLLQRVSGEAADHAALTLRPGQLRGHHVGGAVRVSVLAQRLRDDRRAADVDLERLAVVEVLALGESPVMESPGWRWATPASGPVSVRGPAGRARPEGGRRIPEPPPQGP